MSSVELDKLFLMRGRSYTLSDNVKIKHPTLGQIEEIGYQNYLVYTSTFTSSINDYADILFCEANVWYEDLTSEWNFFLEREMLAGQPKQLYIEEEGISVTGLFASEQLERGLNFFFEKTGKYVFISKTSDKEDTKQTLLYNVGEDNGNLVLKKECFKFNEYYFHILRDFLIQINHISAKYDFLRGGTKGAKKAILNNIYNKRKRKPKNLVTLSSIISSLVAKGTSYGEIWDYPIYFVYDQYFRHGKIEDYHNIATAWSNGSIDTEKNPIDWEKINWATVI